MGINLQQMLVNILMTGSLYCLVAIGLTLVFSILDIVNFAHGEYYMLGGFAAYYFSVSFGINYFLAIVLAIISVVLFALFIERFTIRPQRGQVVPTLIICLGVSMLLQAIAIITFGSAPKSIPAVSTGIIRVVGITIPFDRLIVLLLSIVLIAAVYIYIQRGRMGRALRAYAQNADGAKLQGVNVNRIGSFGFAVGCGLAAAAGALLGSVFFVEPMMGLPVIVRSMAIIILGGFGSIIGTVVGSYLLASVESTVASIWGTPMALLCYYGIALVVLLIRPRGLMGGHE